MNLYVNSANETTAAVAVDDMILTKDLPTTAGSRMLENFTSLFNAEIIDKLTAAGCDISGKVNVGEFAIDMLGETSYFGAVAEDEKVQGAPVNLLKNQEVEAVITLDANGAPRRMAALSDLMFLKPTYGTVSRYGIIPVACSGDTVGIMGQSVETIQKYAAVIAGHDDKDSTSLPADDCKNISISDTATVKKVAIIGSMCDKIDAKSAQKIEQIKEILCKKGVEVGQVEADVLELAKEAWNVLLCAELCNNVSRYDGIKYGYRTPNYKTIDELYVNSRTEAFGALLKTAILYGSHALSTENYMKLYDKSLRVRRLVCEQFAKLFEEYDAVILPACSKSEYTTADVQNTELVFEEARYTAPASISGLPTMVVGGVQIITKALHEKVLYTIANMYEKEGK